MRLRWKLAQAAEIRWWQYYLKDKPTEQYLVQKKRYWNRIMNQLKLKLQSQERILDAGCGPAGIFIILDKNEVDALDPLLEEYENRLSHFQRSDYPNVHFYTQRLEDFKIKAQYDTIFCLNAINHVDDIQQSLERLIQLIKPGGRLFLSVDAHNYSFFKFLFRLVPGDVLHPHQYDIKEYRTLLENLGCSIVDVQNLKQNFFFDYYIIQAKFK